MSSTTLSHSQADIFVRAIEQATTSMPDDVAKFFLAVELSPSDRARLDELAARAGQGTLSDQEQAELEEFRRCGRLVELIKVKARLALQSRQ